MKEKYTIKAYNGKGRFYYTYYVVLENDNRILMKTVSKTRAEDYLKILLRRENEKERAI